MRTPFDPLWDYSDPAHTQAVFEAFRPQVADDLNLTLQLLTQIARTHSLRGQFDHAHELLDSVEKNTPLDPDFDLVRVRLQLERGRTFNSAGQKAVARPLFLAAFEKAVDLQADFYAVDAAHMMGIVEPPAEQISWTEKALARAEQSADRETQMWLGSLYNNLGWSYHDCGDYEKALDIFQRGSRWQSRHRPGQPSERIARWTVGRALRSLGRCQEALLLQLELEKLATAADQPDGYIYEELGELYLALGQPDAAVPHFANAHELLSADRWLREHEAERLKRLKSLSTGG